MCRIWKINFRAEKVCDSRHQYNDKIEVFPTCIVAQNKGFERIPEFKASEEANNPVRINMTD